MVLKDRYDLKISTSSDGARQAYVEAVDAILSATGNVENALDKCINADPNFALAYSAKARILQLKGKMSNAKQSAEKAVELAANATDRERQHAQIFQLLTSGQGPAGLELIRKHVNEHPTDAFALAPACSVFGLIGFSGRVDRENEQVELLRPLAGAYGDDWWFATVYGFALVEIGEWVKGREMVENALKQNPRSAHTAHVWAHALYEAGEDKLVADYLERWLPDYALDNYLSCHCWWHFCLSKLMLGEHESVLPIYEKYCSPKVSNSPSINVFTDGAALLWRSELAGMDRSEKHWQELLEFRKNSFPKPMVFVDAHGALPSIALNDQEDVNTWHDALIEAGQKEKLPAGLVPAELVKAFKSHAQQDWSNVITTLEPITDEVVRIGGSRAQRDLIQNTYLSALINDGRVETARSFLNKQHDRQPSVPLPLFS